MAYRYRPRRWLLRDRTLIGAAAIFFVATLISTLLLRPPRNATQGPVPQGSAQGPAAQAHIVSVTILQINDVYEMFPVDGRGGLARVATLRQQLEAENKNTITVLAGDLVSPSALGQARVDGRPLAGQQMVELMGPVGLKYAVFGNHEFDLKKDQLLARIGESKFTWLGSNVVEKDTGHQLAGTKPRDVVTLTGEGGAQVRIGLFGLTIKTTAGNEYIRYDDAIAAARTQVAALAPLADVVVALTHLTLPEDEALANAVPGIALVIGGHEHQNIYARRGSGLTPIAKADSNARTVYVHRLRWDADSRRVEIDSQLTPVTDALAEDAAIATAASGWRDRAFAAFRKDGFEPDQIVTTLTAELDATEASVRTTCTPLTRIIGSGMVAAVPGAVAAIFNSGSIRLDDVLRPGPVTQYDVMRLLPYPSTLSLVRIRGATLAKVLGIGDELRNSGGYLQTFGIESDGHGGWKVAGTPIAADVAYSIAMNDYLRDGKEKRLEFLKSRDASFSVVKPDVAEWRKASMAALKAAPGGLACPSAPAASKPKDASASSAP